MRYFIQFAIFTAAGLYIYNQVQKLKNVRVKFRFIQPVIKEIPDYGFEKLPVNIGLVIDNTTAFLVNLKTIKLDVFVNGKLAATVFKTAGVNIAANAKTPVTVKALLDIKNLSVNLSDLIATFTQNKPGALILRGFIDSSAGRLTVNEKIEL